MEEEFPLRISLFFSAVALSTMFSATNAVAAEGVVVARLEAKTGVTEQDIDSLSGLLSAEVEKHASGKVISDADVKSLLQADERKKLCGGTETTCLAEIGGALGVPEVISGDLGRVGQLWIVNLRRIDVAKALVLRRVGKQVEGDITEVVRALPAAVATLYAPTVHEEIGQPLAAPTGPAGHEPATQAASSPPATTSSHFGEAPSAQAAKLPDNPGGSRWTWVRWGALGGGAACLALGAVASWQTGVAADDYGQGAAGSGDARSRHDRWQTTEWISLPVGAVLVASGAALWLFGPQEGHGPGSGGATATLTAIPVSGGALVVAGGVWP